MARFRNHLCTYVHISHRGLVRVCLETILENGITVRTLVSDPISFTLIRVLDSNSICKDTIVSGECNAIAYNHEPL